MTANRKQDADQNRDPITGKPGAHPVGTGIGAAVGGMAAGAAAGSVAGPVGTVAGAAAGAIAGGLAGKGIAERIDPSVEEAYWRENYRRRPYIRSEHTFDDYRGAYMCGVEAYARFQGASFDECEAELSREWPQTRGKSRLSWDDAREAARDSWERLATNLGRGM